MKFEELSIRGAYLIGLQPIQDERGFFARTYCDKEFRENGLNPHFVQCNVSYNVHRGTIRGMHYQSAPYEETKLVRCIRGAIYDVIIDLRADSESYLQWAAVELTSDNRKMLYIPTGVAHGFQTLQDDTEVFYQMGSFYEQAAARGIRWDDPAFNITWPLKCWNMSDKDATYGGFELH
ncbi:dTDP-4-dehydrorhamnose 3,5-epimerase [Cohnella lupini]|uniref:dTDP-4-dehydrorhamnose 3,5-epimerase n=1 Tax=Cohnella lupini TaxID=1294267 RepID=A0A3D9I7B5_9BACL|nr:dTDP-4-dehydrorhamnose 3,5-epimerase [Cohnella lupini]RED57581.1 dTDP-4-dehydrorhamnose 3,5-epimerase [Cohnella lupini]